MICAGVFLLALPVLAATSQAQQVEWKTDVESALRSANQSGQMVLMKFTADWCGYCKKMERTTFAEPPVVELVSSNFVPVLVDADKHPDLVKQLKVRGLPAMLIITPDMMIVERITGFQTSDKLMPKLVSVIESRPATAGQTSLVASTQQQAPVAPATITSSAPLQPDTSVFNPAPQTAAVAPAATTPPAADSAPITANPFADFEVQAPPATRTASNPAAEASLNVVAMTREVPVAFGGLCLASVVEKRALVKGKPEFELMWRGKRLRFADELQRQKFSESPQKYWPMLDGNCAMTLLQTGETVEGSLQYAAMFRSKVWLFSSADKMKEFIAAPASIADQIPSETR
jgi:thiol-disulfide isomerase/thioredoxin